jgi:hypothetical protein
MKVIMNYTVKIKFEIYGSKEMKKSLVKRIKEKIMGDDYRCFDVRGFDKENKPYWTKTLKMKLKRK